MILRILSLGYLFYYSPNNSHRKLFKWEPCAIAYDNQHRQFFLQVTGYRSQFIGHKSIMRGLVWRTFEKGINEK